MSVKSRILELQRQFDKNKDSTLKVVFSDGRESRISPRDGIELIQRSTNILRFEDGGGSLADLLNDLL